MRGIEAISNWRTTTILQKTEADQSSLTASVFEQIVAMDLEGIVCKRKDSPYKVTEKPSTILDQSKESEVQPVGRPGGIV